MGTQKEEQNVILDLKDYIVMTKNQFQDLQDVNVDPTSKHSEVAKNALANSERKNYDQTRQQRN